MLTKLKWLNLSSTQVTDAGCAALAAALDSGALPALEVLELNGILASEAEAAALMARFPRDSDSDDAVASDASYEE